MALKLLSFNGANVGSTAAPVKPAQSGVPFTCEDGGTVTGWAYMRSAGNVYPCIIESWSDTGGTVTIPANLPTGSVYEFIAGEFGSEQPLDNVNKKVINKIIFFGASFMEQSFSIGSSADILKCDLIRYGFANVNTEVIALSGSTIDEIKTIIQTSLSGLSANEKVLYIGQGAGNDVTETRPFETANADRLHTIGQDIQEIIQSVKSAGQYIIFGRLSYRNYTTNYPDPSYGSLPYNTNIIEPAIRFNNAEYFDFDTEHPVLDYYTLIEQNQDWLEPDGVHPNTTGEQGVRDYTLSIASNYFVSEQVFYKPISGQVFVVDLKWDENPQNSNKLIFSSLGTDNRSFYPTNNYGISPISIRSGNWQDSAATGRGNAGDTTASLTNNQLLTDFWFVSGGNPDIDFTICNVEPNSTAKLRITASRDTTDTNRVGEWTYDTTTQSLDAAANPPEIIEFDIVFDENGECKFTHSIPPSSTFSYVSGIELEF